MTQRLAIAILVTVLGTLVIAGVTAYLTVRAVLIGNLDAVLFSRAIAVPELLQNKSGEGLPIRAFDPSDRYTVQDNKAPQEADDSIDPSEIGRPRVLSRRFTPAGTGRSRVLTVRAFRPSGQPGAAPVPIIVTYSGLMDRVDGILRRLATDLGMFGLVGGLLASYLSVKISQLTLRPLSKTAALIGTIDERRLDSRIDTTRLPRELTPVASRLNGLLAQLEQAFARRKQFLADASHELRTPVAAIFTTLEIALRLPPNSVDYREVIQDCARDASLLRRLVERLTEHAKGEVIAPLSQPEPTRIGPLLEQCVKMVSVLGSRSEDPVCSAPADLTCVIQPDRLRSIVINLLANAVEYSEPGDGIRISCRHDGKSLWLEVSDHGSGIAAEHIAHVFEPFYRADPARSQENQHLGLGLFLVQSHVKAMGGECSVHSVVGTGTTFTVRIPCATVLDECIDADDQKQVARSLSSATV